MVSKEIHKIYSVVISLCFINRIYCNPAQDEWSIPLHRNLLEVINDNWEVIFDEETGEAPYR